MSFDTALHEALTNIPSPGVVLAICDRTQILWHFTRGHSDARREIPVDLDTLFCAGSVTRAFTAQALLILRDEGHLALDEPLSRSVPEAAALRYPTLDSPRLTLRHLLTHTSGLARSLGALEAQREREPDVFTFAEHVPSLTFDHAPGTHEAHSTLDYALLGLVVHRKSGKPFDVFVKERILDPLSMSTATFHYETLDARLATPFADRDGVLLPNAHRSIGAFLSDGGLNVSARELVRFVGFQLDAWPPRDDRDSGPLCRASVRESHRIGGLQRLGRRAVGLGWEMLSDRPLDQILWHNGRCTSGYQVAVAFEPTVGIGIVALANSLFHSDRPLRALLSAYALDHNLVKDERR